MLISSCDPGYFLTLVDLDWPWWTLTDRGHCVCICSFPCPCLTFTDLTHPGWPWVRSAVRISSHFTFWPWLILADLDWPWPWLMMGTLHIVDSFLSCFPDFARLTLASHGSCVLCWLFCDPGWYKNAVCCVGYFLPWLMPNAVYCVGYFVTLASHGCCVLCWLFLTLADAKCCVLCWLFCDPG